MTATMKTIVVLFIIATTLLLESQGAPAKAKDLRRERRGADDDVSFTRSLQYIFVVCFYVVYVLFKLYFCPLSLSQNHYPI